MAAPIVALYGSGFPADMIPMRRMGDEQDMAGIVLYLASRAGAYCNGGLYFVDGARLLNFPSTY
jgi:NAD(P)-dependent dehydrogenase (short-subunit alcohol dehydrogenase family)